MKNAMKASFQARNENVTFARTLAIGFLVNINLEMSVVNEIKTVVSEAVTNAIVHGYQEDPEKWVHFSLSYDENNIWLEISDQGIGIADIEKAREPLFSTKLDEERAGLGFTIMEVFTDYLEINSTLNRGTTIKMLKKYNESH